MATTPSGPFKPPGTKQTSQSGPWGGGTGFTQSLKQHRDFSAINPIAGHTQKRNVSPVIKTHVIKKDK